MFVDLHIHTNASDGTWDRHELIERLLENNIILFSIADHDTIMNSKGMLNELEDYNLRHLIGVEISCTYLKTEYHITAYSFDPGNDFLIKLLKANRQERSRGENSSMKDLATINPQVEYHKFENYQYQSERGGFKSLNFLLDNGVVSSLSEYFDLFSDPSEYFSLFGDPNKIFTFQDPAAIIRIVKKARGVPFLAHPNVYFDDSRMPQKELEKWIDFGISGIECYSSYCGIQDAEEYVKFCKKNDLLVSGGSDCHGTFLSRKLGNPRITIDMLNLGSLI